MTVPTLTLAQTTTLPRNDVADDRSGISYAFTNATLVVDPQTTIQNATLLVQGAFVRAAGRDVKIPPGAVVVNLQGKRIYPALLDVYADYGLPEVKRGERSFGRSQLESNKKGAYSWNQAVQPEVDAAEQFTANPQRADELRKMGFGAVLSHLPDGVVRGTSVLVNLLDGKEQDAIVKGAVSAHYSFDKGSSTQDYPLSMMGSVALLRQTYYDANWYKRAQDKTEYNISLDKFNQNQGLPQVFEANDKLAVLRADKIGDEFGVQYVIKGGGDEYQLLNEVKATGASLIIPINFPQAFDVEDPYDALAVSLAELKHWEMAPANPGMLAKAGVSFALTMSGLKDKKDFWPNLRKAIDYGLSEQAALAALTTVPAQLLKMDGVVGTLRPGALANFLITSDNLFKADNILFETWIKGRRHVVNNLTLSDLRGTYTLTLGNRSDLKINVTGKSLQPEFQILANDTSKIPAKFSRINNLVTLTFALDKKTPGETRLSGYLADDKTLKGDGLTPDGQALKWLANWQEFKEPPVKADSVKPVPQLGKIVYPFIAFGNEEKPKMQTILVKNATVWTNEKDGILTNSDVLLENGKIARIGKNLSSPNARVIDGTGKHLTNGIFDEHSHIALLSINEAGQSVSAEVRQADVIDSEDINIYRQLAGGVTSAQLLHGSANSIGGQSAIIKLKWGEAPENLKIKDADGFIKFALGENVTRKSSPIVSPRYPISRMGVEQVMVDAFNRARAYEGTWKTYNALTSKVRTTAIPPRRDLELDALVEILNSKRFITCHSYVQSEINMLMKVAEQFGFRVNTFTHILEGYKVADKMLKHGAGGSSFSDWWAYKMEVKDAIPYNPALMHRVGVTVSINSDDAEMARRLNQEAAKSVEYGGISEEDAWKMVTLNPAKLMHLDQRLGSIRPGKDADVVLWNNHPLSIYARPEKTIIDGAVYFDLDQEAKKQEAIDKERARITQKMLAAKTSGAPTSRPTPRRPIMWHCEDVEGMEELNGGHEK
ncbi:MAG: amidohydrolase family protein [Cytophagaceae bacterium]|nr:amidohydrolase family protein [Cytophagaceae bacterium]